MATPIGKATFPFDEVLMDSLAEILGEDHQQQDDEPVEFVYEIVDESMTFEVRPLETIEEVLETSYPSSPCKPSPHRMPLCDKTNNLLRADARDFNKRAPSHWSHQADDDDCREMVPIPKVRRTLSECIPTPVSILNSPGCPKSLSDVDNVESGESIPWHSSTKDAIRRITPATLVGLLDGQYSGSYDRLIVVDARYPYEYLGGHIPSAVNICGEEAAEKYLFSPELLTATAASERIALVFHCEFSSERAPRQALHIRQLDRTINADNYPRLTFPDMYILEGGYRAYWQQFADRCDPPGQYLPMRTQRFRDDLRFHQRMKSSTAATSNVGIGFNGNKYNRTKIRSCAVGGVGLRKSASTCIGPSANSGNVEAYMATARLAPGESMPAEFPSSDGPDIFHGTSYIKEAGNCFLD